MSATDSIQLHLQSRRRRSRLKTCLGANATSLSGTLGVDLVDISLTGAKLRIVNRRRVVEGIKPKETVVLNWAEFEAFGTVVWVDGDFFGIQFDEIVSPHELIVTRDINDRLTSRGGRLAEFRDAVRDWVDGRY